MKVLRFALLTQIDCAFAYSAGLHVIIMHTIYALLWTDFFFRKKVCGCHTASCGSFLLGWHAGVVLCHRASWDIMWAYQVATRVSCSVWVTGGLLILELYHFLPLSFLKLEGTMWGRRCGIIVETESSLKDWEFSPHAYKTTAGSKEHTCFDVDGMLMTFNTEAKQKCRNINRIFKKNNNDICTIKNE